MKDLIFLSCCFILLSCSNKENTETNLFIITDTVINDRMHYFILNSKGDTVRKLNPDKFSFTLDDTIKNFLVVTPRVKGKYGFWAMDLNERFLFPVYNRAIGEPDPDEITDGMIRIIDEKGKIGFANDKGEIIISPRFESATPFFQNHAIIGQQCENIPLVHENHSGDCKHFRHECKEYGYIDKTGTIIKNGYQSEKQL